MYREGSGFPSGSVVKNPPAMQEPQEILGLGKFSRGGHGDPLQYSCLENSIVQIAIEMFQLINDEGKAKIKHRHFITPV